MTFEEVKFRIASGTAPETLEDISSDIAVLAGGAADVEQSIAIRLYESQKLRGKKGWCVWAMETFGYYDDKATFYRRCGIGEMLYLLREQDTCLFRKHLSTGVTLLEQMLPIMHDEKHGFGGLVNFLRLHWEDGWSRDKLIAERERFLHPDGNGAAKPEQLTFDFDVFTIQEESRIAELIETRKLSAAQTGLLARNGIHLCATALPYMVAHPEAFDDEDIPELEDMRDRLEAAARDLAGLIAAKNRKALES